MEKKITPNIEKRKRTTPGRRLEERGGSRSGSSPCLYSNNSIQPSKTPSETPHNQLPDKYNQLSSAHKKTAFTLASNVERIVSVESESINHVAFLTLTFQENITDHAEAYKRFRSFNSNFLAPHPVYGHWISVKEHQARGAWHYHMIIQLSEDIRTGFDFALYDEWLKGPRKPGTFPTGNSTLRSLWAELGQVLEGYGFGRIFTLEPIKSNAEAIKYYVGKYVSKQIGQRPDADRGVRLINYSRGWVKNSVRCAWNNENSQLWRSKLRTFASECGCSDFYQLSEKFGSTWAYKFQDEIINTLPTPEKFLPPEKEYIPDFIRKMGVQVEIREKIRIRKKVLLSPDDDLVDSRTGEVLF